MSFYIRGCNSKTVINTIRSIKLYSKNNIDIDLINAFGEWSNKKYNLDNDKINIYDFLI